LVPISPPPLSQHPDDSQNSQLKCLQNCLRRLRNGEIDVENHYLQELQTHERGRKTKRWWKRKLRAMYIWLDYMCMPQPSCVRTNEPLCVRASVPPENGAAVTENKRDDASDDVSRRKLSRKGSQNLVQDSRQNTNIKTAQLLSDAVHSLPAYVEMSWLMLVLVPTLVHQDRPDEVVDWCSWRHRGWCR
jgi:hypothetical protein